MRSLLTIVLSRRLQEWKSAAVLIGLGARVAELQAVLEAEQLLKRRQLETATKLKQQMQQPPPKPPPKPQAPPTNTLGRSALDKLFAVIDVWEARRLRPALWAWRRASNAVGGLGGLARAEARVAEPSTGSTCAAGLFAATPQRLSARPASATLPPSSARLAPPSAVRRHQW